MLIVVAGPPGGGKTTFAEGLKGEDVEVISTDDFIHLPWENVPAAVGQAIKASKAPNVVVEGVRAVSCVYHMGMTPDVVYWVHIQQQKRGGRGLTIRQRELLNKMKILPTFVGPQSERERIS